MKKLIYIFILTAFANAFALKVNLEVYNDSSQKVTVKSFPGLRAAKNILEVAAKSADEIGFYEATKFKQYGYNLNLSSLIAYFGSIDGNIFINVDPLVPRGSEEITFQLFVEDNPDKDSDIKVKCKFVNEDAADVAIAGFLSQGVGKL